MSAQSFWSASDVDAEKHDNRGLAKMVGTALLKGRDANHFDLTIGKLMAGPDTYFQETPLDAKSYEGALREALPTLKSYILENEGIEQVSDSFEI